MLCLVMCCGPRALNSVILRFMKLAICFMDVLVAVVADVAALLPRPAMEI